MEYIGSAPRRTPPCVNPSVSTINAITTTNETSFGLPKQTIPTPPAPGNTKNGAQLPDSAIEAGKRKQHRPNLTACAKKVSLYVKLSRACRNPKPYSNPNHRPPQ